MTVTFDILVLINLLYQKFSIFFVEGPVTNYDQARQQATQRYAAFFHSMLDSGVYLPPSAYEAWFVSAAHDDRAVDQIATALPRAAEAAASVDLT